MQKRNGREEMEETGRKSCAFRGGGGLLIILRGEGTISRSSRPVQNSRIFLLSLSGLINPDIEKLQEV